MSYEVLKTIRGRSYRYLVESYRDPETGKARNRWRYLGKADGQAPPRRRARADQTRASLRAALERLLGRLSWNEITVHAIASEAGVTSATLYRYFSSRDEVLRACARASNDELDAHLRELHQLAPNASAERDRLRAWAQALRWSGGGGAIANEGDSRGQRSFERYFELLAVHAYVMVPPRDRAGLAMTLWLIVQTLWFRGAGERARLRDDECRALSGTIERLIFTFG